MVKESELLEGVKLRIRSRVDVEIREWEDSSLLPAFNLRFDLRGPEQICLFRSNSTLLLNWHIHIRTTTVVFRAIATVRKVSYDLPKTKVSSF